MIVSNLNIMYRNMICWYKTVFFMRWPNFYMKVETVIYYGQKSNIDLTCCHVVKFFTSYTVPFLLRRCSPIWVKSAYENVVHQNI
mmetsp:Transcript_1069/g.1399  ORF Transcript_1069/g.1399 Transcript_1069/m.1399 type:complete len:85 (+) Transcript_1069:1353-1607(+)